MTLDDLESLEIWAELFGPPFEPVLVFVYWCDEPLEGALFHETFAHRGRWYAARAIRLEDYRSAMRPRSPRWGTVHLASADFERLSRPFTSARPVPMAERARSGPRYVANAGRGARPAGDAVAGGDVAPGGDVGPAGLWAGWEAGLAALGRG